MTESWQVIRRDGNRDCRLLFWLANPAGATEGDANGRGDGAFVPPAELKA